VKTPRAIAVYAALWSPVALGFAFALALTDRLPWPSALLAGVLSALPAAALGLGVIWLCARLPWRETPTARLAAAHVVGAVVFSSLWSAAIVTEIWSGAPREAVNGFLQAGLAWQLVTGAIVYALVVGVVYTRGAMDSEARHAALAERAETLRLRAELGALRARLDPHFLFNVLQTVGALATEQPSKVHTALEHLSHLLRRRIDASGEDADGVTFADELTDTREYLALERLRFGDRLRVSEDVDPETLPLMVPRFLLQPLVENAIRHGLAGRADGGNLAIATRRNGTGWMLSVADDGDGADAASVGSASGVGLSVLRERLRLRFGENGGAVVETSPRSGFKVTVRLPVSLDE